MVTRDDNNKRTDSCGTSACLEGWGSYANVLSGVYDPRQTNSNLRNYINCEYCASVNCFKGENLNCRQCAAPLNLKKMYVK